ncbi:permease [Micromonospora sp. NPDC047620]|uniref:permease n=1 Tax=Micromonospora sp. NPDC047620 TaxID=3364251 RepID=UPI00371565F0
MNDVVEIVRLTLYYVVHLAMWFVLAIFISAMVDLLYLDIVARRSLRRRKGWVGVVAAAAVGAFSPFCSFIVIPLIRKLLASGIPLSAVMAFWVASPTMDPEIFAMTAAQIGMPLATARLVGAVLLSLGAGFTVLLMERRGMFKNVLRTTRFDDRTEPRVKDAQQEETQPVLVGTGTGQPASTQPAPQPPTTSAGQPQEPDDDDDLAWWPTAKASLRSGRNWRITFRNMGRDTIDLGKWLLLACLIEALVVMYVPEDLVGGLFGASPFIAIPLAAFIGVPLYMNGVGAIPIVDGLLAKGMSAGAVVTFLLGGAVTTVPAMAAVRSIVTNRVFLMYLGVSVIGSILIGFLAEIFL